MAHRSIHVVTALAREADAIRRQLRRSQLHSVRVTAVGIRAGRMNAMPPFDDRAFIIVAGLAGGLDPKLSVGDVVLDAPDEIAVPPGAVRGRIHSATSMVESIDTKSKLFLDTGAIAVDMEQAAVAAWAAKHHCTVIGLRGISDAATDPLDPILLTLVDDLGRPRPIAIAKALLRRPGRIVSLLRLARRSHLALANLSIAVVELVRSLV